MRRKFQQENEQGLIVRAAHYEKRFFRWIIRSVDSI